MAHSARELVERLFDALDDDGNGSLDENEGKAFLLLNGCIKNQVR